MSGQSLDSVTSADQIQPFAPNWPLPYDSLLVNGSIFGVIGLAHFGYTSIWWAFLILAVYLLPPEVHKVYQHGLSAYADALGFSRPTRRDGVLYVGGLVTIIGTLVALLYATVTVATTVTGVSPQPPTQGGHLLAQATFTLPIYIGAIVLMFVMIGPEEEFFFRDKLVGWLQSKFGRWKGIVAGNAVFSIAHLPVIVFIADMFWMTVPFVVLFCVGCIFSLQYEKTDNLLVPAMTHATYNSIILTVLFVTQTA